RLPCRQLGEGGDCGAAEETRKSVQLKQSRAIAKSEAMIIELRSSLKSRNDAPLNPDPVLRPRLGLPPSGSGIQAARMPPRRAGSRRGSAGSPPPPGRPGSRPATARVQA